MDRASGVVRGRDLLAAGLAPVVVASTVRRPAFELRGEPAQYVSFHDNVVEHGSEGEAAVVDCFPEICHADLRIDQSKTSLNTQAELGVGDFDGDGRSDVFQGTGAAWYYRRAASPSGASCRGARIG